MDCASCATTVERALGTLQGVEQVDVDVMQGTVQVTTAAGGPGSRAIGAAIRRAGYQVVSVDGASRTPRGRQRATVLGGVLLAVGLGVSWGGGPTLLATILLGLATIISGWYVAPRALGAVRNRSLDIHVLMTVAALGAAFIGEWGEAAAAMWLFGVAQWLEGYAVGRARHAIGALMDVVPRQATVRRNGRDLTLPVDQVQLGEALLIRPGDRAPLDGIVRKGASAFDQSPITGESVPVEKVPGDDVFAGSINGPGSVEVEVTHLAQDTMLARILHAVENARSSRAPVQTFVDRFARVYTPVVVLLSVGVALVPPLALGAGWEMWLARGLTLLVVACPCALVIATPVSIASGLAGAARRGVLIKGGAQLEALAQVTTVAFDKTGTLTEGDLEVTDVVSLNGVPAPEVLRYAAGIERHSEHAVAKAIVRHAHNQQIAIPEPTGFSAMLGSGARGTIDGRELFVGNTRVCASLGNCDDDAHRWVDQFEQEGKTGVVLMDHDGPLGVLALADRVRPSAASAIRQIRDRGIDDIVMMTGDNLAVAEAVSASVAIREVRSGLLPVDKQVEVERLRQQGRWVAVVGDGINDTPALAAADVGIAMGVAGTPAALEVADVALMGDDLTVLPRAFRHAQRTQRILRSNLGIAIGLKAVFLVLAGVGVATLWMAVAADTGVTVLVVMNALRAMRG